MAITRTTWTDDNGTGTTGTIINNAALQAIYSAVENWALDSYTPSWTASSVNPAIGNGTASGKYLEIGDMVIFSARIAAGSTTTYGTGNYSISLPVTAATSWPGLVNVFAQDASAGGAIFNGVGFVATTTTVALYTQHDSAVGTYTPTVPITFANGDLIHVFGVYFRA